ncbi:hypothetical protein [Streptomyces sp. NPDC018693]|uniref:hypothetical protein n=1 Tax=unclassified Streptomyces TaxID=2593676 RepID=UPI00379B6A77
MRLFAVGLAFVGERVWRVACPVAGGDVVVVPAVRAALGVLVAVSAAPDGALLASCCRGPGNRARAARRDAAHTGLGAERVRPGVLCATMRSEVIQMGYAPSDLDERT